MGVNLQRRDRARALGRPGSSQHRPPAEVDRAILSIVRRHGARDGVQLLAEVGGPPAEVVDRLIALVASNWLRHDGRVFELRSAR